VSGKVVRMTNFGAFVELEEGLKASAMYPSWMKSMWKSRPSSSTSDRKSK